MSRALYRRFVSCQLRKVLSLHSNQCSFFGSATTGESPPQKTNSDYVVKLDPEFDNPRWLERHKWMFNFLDKNGDGMITLDEIVDKANNQVCANLDASPEQTKVHLDAVEGFFKGCGMDYGKEVAWEEYIEGWKTLATNELDKWSRDEITLIRIWGDAVFDIFDADAGGSISLEEWQRYGRISGIMPSDEDAKKAFEICDIDNNGMLHVDEMTRAHLGFWYTMDPTTDGLYGGAVP